MRKRLTGIVTSSKMDKSLRVEIDRRQAHPQYGKIVRRRTVCYAHDENNDAHEGDLVEIIESRPRSKTKRWELVRIVRPSAVLGGAADEFDQADLSEATTESNSAPASAETAEPGEYVS